VTTKKQADELATAMLLRIRSEVGGARLDDLEEKHFHEMLSRKLRRTFNEVERLLCDELPTELEGKTQTEMADIIGRAFDGVMSLEMDLIDLEFL